MQAVFTNRDYEPYAKKRDAAVKAFLDTKKVAFHNYKDHIVFEKEEVTKKDGTPYTVFTPYKRKWLAKLAERLEDVNGVLQSFRTNASTPDDRHGDDGF